MNLRSECVFDAKAVGKRIAELRKRRNMTQRELASELNVIDKTISRWECGYGLPDLTIIPELAAILGVEESKPGLTIDHVYSDAYLYSYKIIRTRDAYFGSDHCPVFAELEL